MRLSVLLMLCLTFIGCGSSMVTTRSNRRDAYAPVNESRGGTIRYILNGFTTKAAGRRSAYEKMFNQCGGSYRIDSEYQSKEYANIYWNIDFTCVN